MCPQPIQAQTELQKIQLALDERIGEADTLLTIIDDHSKLAELDVKETMAALRRTIDEHERSTLEKISTWRAEEKKQLDDYKNDARQHLRECDLQKAKLEMLMLMKDGSKTVRSIDEFDDDIRRSNETMRAMQMPRRSYHFVQGLRQLQSIQVQIARCGRYIRCSNQELERRIVDSDGQELLDVDDMKLTPLDMEVVTSAVRYNRVRSNGSPFSTNVLCRR